MTNSFGRKKEIVINGFDSTNCEFWIRIWIWIRCGDRREEEEKDVVESRIGEAISDEEAEAAGGSDGRGDSGAALESRSGAEDQRQGAELRGDRIRQQRSQSSACGTRRSLAILELGASDDRRNEWILHGYSGDS